MLVRIANREDPDQTASSEADCLILVWAVFLGLFVRQLVLKVLEHLSCKVNIYNISDDDDSESPNKDDSEVEMEVETVKVEKQKATASGKKKKKKRKRVCHR